VSRAVPEWIGEKDDTPIPLRVKARVILSQDGICACGCGVKLGRGETIEIDHIVALINGGENRETNLQALRHGCHKNKTKADVAVKAKTARIKAKHLGITKSKSPLPGGRDSAWKRKVGGGWERR
jgi:5-methylcytosine-specific restriction protein A